MKNFLKFAVVPLLLALPQFSFAEINKIIFTTDPQTVTPGSLSGPMTVQAQDSSGNAFQTTETLDLEFVSSSATGEFLNSAGNPATTYMSKNTANRTFYYKDSSSGTFEITVNATGRDSGTHWTTHQTITISSSAETNSNGGSQIATTNNESNFSLSATSGASAPSYSSATSQLEVSAGSDRLTSPGSPITFQAQIKKNSASASSVKFNWSFGDGANGSGVLVTHTYEYPGEYAVVLNASAGSAFATSRLKVKVVEPNFEIIPQDSYIEIKNNTAYEINLFNWKLVSENRGFIFQPDTIILPRSGIKINRNLLLLRGEIESNTVLKNSLGQVVSMAANSVKPADIQNITAQFNDLKQRANTVVDLAISAGLVGEIYPNAGVSEAVPALATKTAPQTNKISQSQATKTDVIYEALQRETIFTRLTNFIKRLIFK